MTSIERHNIIRGGEGGKVGQRRGRQIAVARDLGSCE